MNFQLIELSISPSGGYHNFDCNIFTESKYKLVVSTGLEVI
jgi:hypothetical protein